MANAFRSTRGQAGVKVEGLSTLNRTMRQAGEDLGELKEANREAAGIVAGYGAPRTPRRTGRLAATVKARPTQTAARVTAGTPKSVPYAAPIHWGWPARNIRWQPWLADAANATEPVWLPRYSAEIDRIVSKVKGAP